MRIAIVNDMPLAVETLRRAVEESGEHHVVWTAGNGAEAVERCAQDLPDLVLMDLVMPVMDGVEATRRIMASTPCPILVVTASVSDATAKVFKALGAGAQDAVSAPVLGAGGQVVANETFLRKIRMLERLLGFWKGGPAKASPRPSGEVTVSPPLVAIGASTGGPGALATILAGLPATFSAAVAIVQHINPEFAPGLVEWLARHARMEVRLAVHGERVRPGVVTVARGHAHMAVGQDGSLRYEDEPRQAVYRPSVDVFFRSLAERWQGRVCGVLLTGMGRDGAAGLLALRERGHLTLAQDRATSAMYQMPKAAVEWNAASEVLAVQAIAPELLRWSAG
jgi:two-component system response regulator WspF